MLSASAYSFRMKSRLAISLSWVGGYTNVIMLIAFGEVVSHMTGNTTQFGRAVGEIFRTGGAETPLHRIAYFAFLVTCFLLGAAVSGGMTETARRRGRVSKYILPIALEAILLSLVSIGIAFHHRGAVDLMAAPFLLYCVTGMAAMAMGLQNATITKISGAVVRTTHLTGVLTDLGLESVQYLLWVRDRTRAAHPLARQQRGRRIWRLSRRHASAQRIVLLASIYTSFLFGVVAGAIVYERWPLYSMLAPVGFLLWIIWVDWRKPIADVKELDLTADPEYGGYDAIKSILPPDLGLYRLTHHRKDAQHHAPDFQAWVARLPRHWRVVILAVSPMTSFDPDAVLDLSAALQTLRAEHRDLVVCGVRPVQYVVLNKSGFTESLGMENLCPDLDMAIARGLNRVAELADHATN